MKKIALVTGGSRGIGEAVCRELAKNDYYVYINYLHSKESAEKIADEINGQVVCFDAGTTTRWCSWSISCCTPGRKRFPMASTSFPWARPM